MTGRSATTRNCESFPSGSGRGARPLFGAEEARLREERLEPRTVLGWTVEQLDELAHCPGPRVNAIRSASTRSASMTDVPTTKSVSVLFVVSAARLTSRSVPGATRRTQHSLSFGMPWLYPSPYQVRREDPCAVEITVVKHQRRLLTVASA